MFTDAGENGVNEAVGVDGAFTADERLIHGLLLRRSDENLILKELEERMTPEKLQQFNDKRDFEGRTLLVNAIHGQYEKIVKKLLVRFAKLFPLLLKWSFSLYCYHLYWRWQLAIIASPGNLLKKLGHHDGD